MTEPPKRPNDTIRPIEWSGPGLRLLDQRRLPERSEWLVLGSAAEVAAAIRDMVVRGAPAIGIAAAYGAVLAARERYAKAPATWKRDLARDLALLGEARPTAVNLRWALRRMAALVAAVNGDPGDLLLAEARRIHDEDIAANHRMGDRGAALIAGHARNAGLEDVPCGVLTHCNAGALATGGYGTALGVIRSAWGAGAIQSVLADETRPWLQGARLTAWELVQDGIPVELIADAAAAWAMAQGRVRWVIVGADRIAANGDTANKIGTCGLAVSAHHYGVGFMVVAPTSTIDMELAQGGDIPIEARSRDELLEFGGRRVAAGGAGAWNPVFDVTPADLIDAIVTERGVVEHPDREKMAALMAE